MNNRFQVLTTHADTLDAVLDDTLVNRPLQQESRTCKQQIVDIKNSNIGIDKPDPVGDVVPMCLEVSRTTSSCTPVENRRQCPGSAPVSPAPTWQCRVPV